MHDIWYFADSHPVLHPAPAAHPESSDKLALVEQWLRSDVPVWLRQYEPVRHSRVVPTFVHRQNYVTRLEQCAASSEWLDPDTYTTPTSLLACQRISDALTTAIDLAVDQVASRSIIISRPPGHHAESSRGIGFCLQNHIAIAAQYAIREHRCSRVAIVDFDVHHGNGTQELFYDRSDVLYASIHQYPFYPGTGHSVETGHAGGEGFTVNCPVPAGSADDRFLVSFAQRIIPRIEEFSPELILVSAGFDAHHLDPLGGLALTGAAFHDIGRQLAGLADKTSGGKIVSLLEGGYSQEGLLDGLQNYLKGLRT